MNHSWNIRRLGDICTSELGKTRDEKRNKGTFRPYLCAINVQWDRFDLSELKEMRFEDDEYDRYTIRKGDLVICEGGDIGRAAIWDNEQPIYYQNALHRVRFVKGIDARFILYYFMYLKQTGILDGRYGKGVTIKHLVKSTLVSIPVPVPPIVEQQRIVSELDLLTGIIDKKNAQLRDLDALAQSIFYEMFGDPITNDKGWECCALKDVATIVGGSTPKTNNEEYWGGSNYWVTPAEIHGERYYGATERTISDLAVKSTNLTLLPIGTVLLSSRAPIGKVAITTVPMYCNQGFKNIICSDRLNNEYICQALLCKTDFLQALGTGATFKEISKKTTENIKMAIPPLALQKEFAAKAQMIEQQKKAVGQSLVDAQALFDSKMSHYFV